MKRMVMVVLALTSCIFLITGCGSNKNVVGPATGGKSISSDTAFGPHPTGLQATAVSTNQINLTWNDNSGYEEGYEITRTETKTGLSLTWEVVAKTGIGSTYSYSDTIVLTSNTAYSYKVRAYGRVYDVIEGRPGYSHYSNEVSATTK